MSQSATGSDDRVDTLRALWTEGLSAAQIARQLGGVTRNAVIGKIHRLALGGRAAPSAPGRAPRAAAPRSPRPARAVPAPRPRHSRAHASATAPEGPGLVDDLAHLPAHACKWPIGDPKQPGFSFCGRSAEGRYCAAHERVGVQPDTAWRAHRDPVVRRALAGLV